MVKFLALSLLLFAFSAFAAPVENTESNHQLDEISSQFYNQLNVAKQSLKQLLDITKQRASELLAKIPTVDEMKQKLPLEQAKQVYEDTINLAKSGAIRLYQRVPVKVKSEVGEAGKKVVNVFQHVLPEAIDEAVAQGKELYARVPEFQGAISGHIANAKQFAADQYQKAAENAAKFKANAAAYLNSAGFTAYEEAKLTGEETKQLLLELKEKAELVLLSLNKENFENLKQAGLVEAKNFYEQSKSTHGNVADGVRSAFQKVPIDQLSKVFSRDGVAFLKLRLNQAQQVVRQYFADPDQAPAVYVRTLAAARERISGALESSRDQAIQTYERLRLEVAQPYVESLKSALAQLAQSPAAQKLRPAANVGAEAVVAAYRQLEQLAQRADTVVDQFFRQLNVADQKLTELQEMALQRAGEILAKLPTVEELKQRLPVQQAQEVYGDTIKMAKVGAIRLYARLPVEVKDDIEESRTSVVNLFQEVIPEAIDDAIEQGRELYAKVPELQNAVNGHITAARQFAGEQYAKFSALASDYFNKAKLTAFEETRLTIEETRYLAEQLKEKSESVLVAINRENFEKLKQAGLIEARNIYKMYRDAAIGTATAVSQAANVAFLNIPVDQIQQVLSKDGVAFVKLRLDQAQGVINKYLDAATPVYVRTLNAAHERVLGMVEGARQRAIEGYQQLHLEAAQPYVDQLKKALDQFTTAAGPVVGQVVETLKPGAVTLGAAFNVARAAAFGFVDTMRNGEPSAVPRHKLGEKRTGPRANKGGRWNLAKGMSSNEGKKPLSWH